MMPEYRFQQAGEEGETCGVAALSGRHLIPQLCVLECGGHSDLVDRKLEQI